MDLREPELWFSCIFESLDEAVLVVTEDRAIVHMNKAAERMYGYSNEEVSGRSTEIFHVDSSHYEEFGRQIKEAFDSGEIACFEYKTRRKNGEVFPTEHTVSLLKNDRGETLGIVSVVRDISGRKAIEAAIRESSRKLKEAVNAGNVGLWDWDLLSNRVFYSDEWKRQIGCDSHEISDDFEEWRSRVHPDDLKGVLDHVETMIARKAKNYQLEFRFRHKDGSYIWILAQASVTTDESGRPVRALGSHVDITERKEVEKQLELSEQRYMLAEKLANIGHWEWDVSSQEISWSNGVHDIFRVSPHETRLVYDDFKRYVHAADLEEVEKRLRESIDHKIPFSADFRIVREDGEERYVRSVGEPRTDGTGSVVSLLGTIQDLTEKRILEDKQIAQTRRLEEMNTALKVLLNHVEAENREAERRIYASAQMLVLPYLDKLERMLHDPEKKGYLEIARTNLNRLVEPFPGALLGANLTPTETQVANLIGYGKSSKEIANTLHVSYETVRFHRKSIRRKLGIHGKPMSLKRYLMPLSHPRG